MNEREKMLAGEIYDSSHNDLVEDRLNAKRLIHQINQLPPDQYFERTQLFQKLLGKSDQFHIEPPFYCDYGYNIQLGNHFYANYNCTMLDCATITIGENVMFAPNVSLFTAGHPIDPDYRKQGMEFAMPITIGNNVWIGGNSVVLPNAQIGNNVVIGAGSVVTKSIPDNCIAVGNPCRVLRPITVEDKQYYFKHRPFNE